jgi:hypothetical protein
MLLLATCCLVAGCGSGDGSDNASATAKPGPNPPAAASLAISGLPFEITAPGNTYSFTPDARSSDGTIIFDIENKPAWTSFDPMTGTLSGIPTDVDIGLYSDIVISATDGVRRVALPPFSIDVQISGGESVLLSWTAPTSRTDGQPLTDLAGYRFYYGREQDNLTYRIDVNNPGLSMYEIGNLSPGNWYFVAAVYDQAGVESPLSNQAVISVG